MGRFEKFLEDRHSGKVSTEDNTLATQHLKTEQAQLAPGSRTSKQPSLQIHVDSPNDSPKLSPWMSHCPTPRSECSFDRLSLPDSKPSVIWPTKWATVGFFDDRDWCWWVMFVCTLALLCYSLSLLVANVSGNFLKAEPAQFDSITKQSMR